MSPNEDENEKERKQMPPWLLLALAGAVIALVAKGDAGLTTDSDKENLEKLQKDLAEARRKLRHAHQAKKRFIASTGASVVTDDK